MQSVGDFANEHFSRTPIKYTVCPRAKVAISGHLWAGMAGLWEGEVGFFTLEGGVKGKAL